MLPTRKDVQQIPYRRYESGKQWLRSDSFQDLFEERAVLLSRIGQHEAALNIYAHKLKRFAMAEEYVSPPQYCTLLTSLSYCAKHYNSEKEEARDVYLSLLRVYLRPPEATPPIPPMVQPAMNLLNKHYQRIDTPKAIPSMFANILLTLR